MRKSLFSRIKFNSQESQITLDERHYSLPLVSLKSKMLNLSVFLYNQVKANNSKHFLILFQFIQPFIFFKEAFLL